MTVRQEHHPELSGWAPWSHKGSFSVKGGRKARVGERFEDALLLALKVEEVAMSPENAGGL